MLLVLYPSSVAESVCQVVRVFGVAASVLHAICTHYCAVETCGPARREKINDLETENQQLYVNTVVRVSAGIISDAEQALDSGASFIVT